MIPANKNLEKEDLWLTELKWRIVLSVGEVELKIKQYSPGLNLQRGHLGGSQ